MNDHRLAVETNSVEDLRQSVLHVGAPNVGNREIFKQFVEDIFERRWFSNNGNLVQELEGKLAKHLGVRNCILVCNATVGLQIACHAIELTGEVIMPAFTFVATAHAAQWEGLRPVFADIDPASHLIDPACIESKITDQTSAILGVHVWGNACDTEAIEAIADRHKLAVIYDAAHAFGCSHSERMIGNFGDCEVFSFHATKFFNTFEGGAITTNDDDLAKKIRLMKNFGFAGMDNVMHLGTNGKMPEICAAMGLTCFESLDEFLQCNRANYDLYSELLGGIPGLRLLGYDPNEQMNYQYVIIEVEEPFGVSRDELVEHLHDQGIRARRYFYPGCHRMEPYRSLYPAEHNPLPNTDRLCQTVACLPTGTAVSESDVRRVCEAIVTCKP